MWITVLFFFFNFLFFNVLRYMLNGVPTIFSKPWMFIKCIKLNILLVNQSIVLQLNQKSKLKNVLFLI